MNLKFNFRKNLKPLSKAEMKKVVGGRALLLCQVDADCGQDVYCIEGVCGGGSIGHCNATNRCASGCATFTDESEEHGVCNYCCLA